MDYLKEFIKYLKYERAVSANTVSTYRVGVRQFFEILEQTDPTKITRQDLVAWRSEVIRTLDQNTAKHKHTAVRAFYRFLSTKFNIPNIAREVLPPLREIVRDPNVPSEYEIEKIVAQPDESTEQGMRDAAITALLASTGVRVSELINLDFGDIVKRKNHFEMNVPLEKGYYQRIVPFANFDNYNDIGANYFGIYWLKLLSIKYDLRAPLFFSLTENHFGKRLNRVYIFRLIRKYAKQSGFDYTKWNVHSFRHFYGTYAIANKTDVLELKELLGHHSVETTMRYVHLWQKISANVALHTSPTSNVKTKYTRAGIGQKILKKM